jgi:hypothetical protein
VAACARNSEIASLAYLTAIDRANRLGLLEATPPDVPLFGSPAVDQTKSFLSL